MIQPVIHIRGVGGSFSSVQYAVAKATLAQAEADNARRQPCPCCSAAILPENMPRHLSFCQD